MSCLSLAVCSLYCTVRYLISVAVCGAVSQFPCLQINVCDCGPDPLSCTLPYICCVHMYIYIPVCMFVGSEAAQFYSHALVNGKNNGLESLVSDAVR